MSFSQALLQANAIAVLNALHEQRAKYHEVTKLVHEKLPSDFSPTFQACDERLEGEIVLFLDWILGDGIASYFLYECDRTPGSITVNGKTYPIGTIEDVADYVAATQFDGEAA